MPASLLSCPRLLVAGLGGGSGKTIVSLGLTRALAEQGHSVQTFKKGPDYIDAKWLSLASKRVTTNLDPFLLSAQVMCNLFWTRALGNDVALIEGNRGLYDGKDVLGSYSSAELAKRLLCPVIVVADCTKVTRTMAAVILGLRHFDPAVDIRGVILNRTAGARHRQVLRDSIEHYTDVPVLGVLPKLAVNPIPERHMGLISDAEFDTDPFAEIASFIREHVDVQRCLHIAQSAPSCTHPLFPLFPDTHKSTPVRIGVVRDAALWFYYQENLDALVQAGAELVEFSLLDSGSLPPDMDGLYMGGGFPETMADRLSQNQSMMQAVQGLAKEGLPIYAECGGLMYLGQKLEYEGQSYPMAGVFDLTTKIFKKPQGHGYMQSKVALPNPYYQVGTELTGHEFHYSRCLDADKVRAFVLDVHLGQGMGAGGDGVLERNCFAGYTHMHALGCGQWAVNFARAASVYQQFRLRGAPCPDIRV